MKILENRLRRTAERRGYVLEKSRRRDPKGKDYARYRLLVDARDIDAHRATMPFTLTIREVEQFLDSIGEDEFEDEPT